MLCASKEDAEREARDADISWPRNATHRGVQLVEIEKVEKRIEALEYALHDILARWDAELGSRIALELPDSIESARAIIGVESTNISVGA